MMERYLSVAEMISIEKASDAAGHTYPKMMACAGKSLADVIFPLGRSIVLGLVGNGNNGGDALVAMTHLLQRGWVVSAYLIGDRSEDPLVKNFIDNGGTLYQIIDDSKDLEQLAHCVREAEVLLDGLLGTGIKLPLKQPIPNVLSVTSHVLRSRLQKPLIVAVDCPSGIDCDSGEVATGCLKADITVCMAAVKQGLLKMPAFGYIGKLVVGDIGLPTDLDEWKKIKRFVLDEKFVQNAIPCRELDSHKGTFGTALVVAGSKNYAGAALLAGEAAFRSGAGWVKMAIPAILHPHLVGHFREATWQPLPGGEDGFCEQDAELLLNSIEKETAILIGPGFGRGDDVEKFIEAFVRSNLPPAVIDADGLKLLASIDNWWVRLDKNSILTPHPGEMNILTGLSVEEIQKNRVDVAEEFAEKWKHIVVLKGAFTVVAEPDGRTAVLPVATPSLARAGTGDVLAGIIVGLLAQKISPFEAAAAGVWLHAQAGLFAQKQMGSSAGVLAGDLVKVLPHIMPA